MTFDDLLSGQSYSPRDGTETVDQGLYVELAPWAFNLMSVEVEGFVRTRGDLERHSSELPSLIREMKGYVREPSC